MEGPLAKCPIPSPAFWGALPMVRSLPEQPHRDPPSPSSSPAPCWAGVALLTGTQRARRGPESQQQQ